MHSVMLSTVVGKSEGRQNSPSGTSLELQFGRVALGGAVGEVCTS